MQYSHEIDQVIMDSIWDISSGYNALKRTVEVKLDRKLSYETFDLHVDRLLENKMIRKEGDTGRRGTSFLYSVTEEAKRKKQLRILGYDRKQILLRKVYEQILLYEVSRWPVTLKLDQVESFLSELGITMKDLKISCIKRLPLDYDIEDKEFYEKHPEFVTTQTTYEPIETKDIRNVWIQIWKNEGSWHVPDDYCIVLPGFSKSEVMYKGKFGDLKPTRLELAEAFDTLLKEHIIKPIGFVFRKEMRYIIADENLRAMMKDVFNVRFAEWLLLYQKWQHLESPTENEKKWLSWWCGEEEAKKFFQHAEVNRYELRKKNDRLLRLTRDSVNRWQSEVDRELQEFKTRNEGTLRQYSYLSDIITSVSLTLHKYLQSP